MIIIRKTFLLLVCGFLFASGILNLSYFIKIDRFQKMGGREVVAVFEKHKALKVFSDFNPLLVVTRGGFRLGPLYLFHPALTLEDVTTINYENIDLQLIHRNTHAQLQPIRINAIKGIEGKIDAIVPLYNGDKVDGQQFVRGKLFREGEGTFVYYQESPVYPLNPDRLFKVVEEKIKIEQVSGRENLYSIKALNDYPPTYKITILGYISFLLLQHKINWIRIFDFSEFREKVLTSPREPRFPYAIFGAFALNNILWSFPVATLPIKLLLPVYFFLMFLFFFPLAINLKLYHFWLKGCLYFTLTLGAIFFLFMLIILFTSLRSIFAFLLQFPLFLIIFLTIIWLIVYSFLSRS